MFEHMKNYEKLMQKVASCLKTNGKLFVHYFCHREYIYHFESDGPSNWMGKYFFSGGTMPSDDTLLYFQKHLAHENTWKVNGNHYSKTLEAWLQLMDTNIDQIRPTLVTAYGQDSAVKFEVRIAIRLAELCFLISADGTWIVNLLYPRHRLTGELSSWLARSCSNTMTVSSGM
mmetsp:Transcript_16881/g.68945  ORF Transcript_16881/g.68945 Transcript_16881/m.68945 type:complete len:173 (+) Transcript_16881:803-1321(+)